MSCHHLIKGIINSSVHSQEWDIHFPNNYTSHTTHPWLYGKYIGSLWMMLPGQHPGWHDMFNDLTLSTFILPLASVVSTQLKNMLVKLDRFQLRQGLKIKFVWNHQPSCYKLNQLLVPCQGWSRFKGILFVPQRNHQPVEVWLFYSKFLAKKNTNLDYQLWDEIPTMRCFFRTSSCSILTRLEAKVHKKEGYIVKRRAR